MTVSEIFEKLNSHLVEGVMFHDQLAEYYDFLNLHGYKRCHEYHAFCEFKTRRKIMSYYLNHYNLLPLAEKATNPKAIPENWYNYTRQEVDAGTKKRAVRDGFAKWVDWEKATKKLYEEAVCNLYEVGEIATACEIKKLVKDVDHELKTAQRKAIALASIDYDMPTVYCEQQEIHDKYKNKMKRG
jgi:hypothetical protein